MVIPKPVVDILDTSHLLPPFLQVSSKITFEKDRQYHKWYLSHLPNGTYWFSYKSHVNKKHKDWHAPLLNLTKTWQDLCTEGLLLPVHSWSSFNHTHLDHHLSTCTLLQECPCSLLTALDMKHPDRDVWLASFWEERDGIESLDTYVKMTLAEYCALQEKGAPCTIPMICVLTIKKDEMMNPLRAKSCIVVLGNHEDRVWTKPKRYAPILHLDSMHLMVSLATEHDFTLKQGDCKNAFCQGFLPDDEITIVKPPIGKPDATKNKYWLLKCTLYGLQCSPCHWYTKINAALNNRKRRGIRTTRQGIRTTL
jgi:hypothetical protein